MSDQATVMRNELIEHLQQANTLMQSGQVDQAEHLLRQIIDKAPHMADAWHLLAMARQQGGHMQEAVHCLKKAIEHGHRHPDTFSNLGVMLKRVGDLKGAEQAYLQALHMDENHSMACNNLGNLLRQQERYQEAINLYRKALAINSDYPEAWRNLSDALRLTGQFQPAEEAARKAIIIHPDFVGAHESLLLILQAQGRLEEAWDIGLKGLHIQKDFLPLHNVMAQLAQRLGDSQKSVTHSRKLVAADPRYAAGHLLLGEGLLKQGDMSKGAQELEWRLAIGERSKALSLDKLWRNEDLQGKRLLVTPEQGLGSMIQMVRYLPAIKAKGAHVMLMVPKPLLALFEHVQGVDECLPSSQALPDFDYHLPILSLFMRLDLSKDKLTGMVPYLMPNPLRVAQWQQQHLPTIKKPRVGLVWQGSSNYDKDRDRSIPLNAFESLLTRNNMQWVVLQKKDGRDQINKLAKKPDWLDIGEKLEDFADTAAVISQLDRVVTVDTAVAHLAGALGKQTLTLLGQGSDWRWFEGQGDSPFYPHMTLLQQEKFGDWSGVIHAVGAWLDGKPTPIPKKAVIQVAASNKKSTRKHQLKKPAGKILKVMERVEQAFSGGRVEEAFKLLTRALEKDPKDPLLLHRLGLIHYQQNRFKEAVELMSAAVAGDPDNADLHTNLGASKRRNGDLLGAISSYKQALELRPDQATAYNNLGNVHMNQGQWDNAEVAFRKAIHLLKDYPEPHRNLAEVLRQKKQFKPALKYAKEATKLKKDYVDAQLVQVNILRDSGNGKQAMEACRPLLGAHPHLAEAHLTMGQLLQSQRDFEKARASLERAIKLNPYLVMAYVHLSGLLSEVDEHDAAIALAEEGAKRNDRIALIFRHLGSLYKNSNRLEDAKTALRKAIALAPQDSSAHMELAFVLIHNGELAEGTKEYEWRMAEGQRLERKFEKPQWDGADPKGKTILVYCEQGQGANIHYARYIPLLAERGAKVIVEAYPSLKEMFSTLKGVKKVIARGERIPSYDYYASMLSMPYLFKTTMGTIPVNIPYLFPEKKKINRWKKHFNQETRPVVGLAWQGNPGFGGDATRSMPLKHYFPMIEALKDQIRFVSIQVSYGREQLVDLPEGMPLEDMAGELNNFSDTLALMNRLDLVISTDTAVPHLMGTQGRNVWMVLSYHSDWRFMLERSDFPWYPTMRLFRQTERKNWGRVIAQVTDALKKWSF
ncbi:tetratricopeptide repeat protein [Magnetococcus sp. PR-3]|uniref:tetratricopeptide repeat protein n=1 Tax=Magnetococcus sp. PR-3 TaxID=3120355 RepID=UPI002FCE4BCC